METAMLTMSAGQIIGVETAIRSRLANEGKALAPFLMAGFPSPNAFQELLGAAQDEGADVIEVGVPFSDPLADGPTIQRAAQACLSQGVTLNIAMELIAASEPRVPIVLMSYLNPLVAYGFSRFMQDGRRSGLRGVIIPDLPWNTEIPCPRNAKGERRKVKGENTHQPAFLRPFVPPSFVPSCLRAFVPVFPSSLDPSWESILLATPMTRLDRLRAIGAATRGYLYAVTVTGVTGVRRSLPKSLGRFLATARRHTPRPVLAGFGISEAETARRVADHCDGVIVGSALVEQIIDGPVSQAASRVGRVLRRMRKALG